jgi:ribosomal protein S12 methylthiotransferase accessory factor
MSVRIEVTFDGQGDYTLVHEGRPILPGAGPLPAPPVLFLGSLAACAGAFAVNYLKARGLPFAGLAVEAEAPHLEGPRRLGDVTLRVVLPGAVEERHLAPLQRSVDLCTLRNTLARAPAVSATIISPVAAAR